MKNEYSAGDVVIAIGQSIACDPSHYHSYIVGKPYIVTVARHLHSITTTEPGFHHLTNGWGNSLFQKATKLDDILLGVKWENKI